MSGRYIFAVDEGPSPILASGSSEVIDRAFLKTIYALAHTHFDIDIELSILQNFLSRL